MISNIRTVAWISLLASLTVVVFGIGFSSEYLHVVNSLPMKIAVLPLTAAVVSFVCFLIIYIYHTPTTRKYITKVGTILTFFTSPLIAGAVFGVPAFDTFTANADELKIVFRPATEVNSGLLLLGIFLIFCCGLLYVGYDVVKRGFLIPKERTSGTHD